MDYIKAQSTWLTTAVLFTILEADVSSETQRHLVLTALSIIFLTFSALQSNRSANGISANSSQIYNM